MANVERRHRELAARLLVGEDRCWVDRENEAWIKTGVIGWECHDNFGDCGPNGYSLCAGPIAQRIADAERRELAGRALQAWHLVMLFAAAVEQARERGDAAGYERGIEAATPDY